MHSFTIVIPTRNRADLVQSAIASAVAQPEHNVEIIVSDNSTTVEQVTATRAAVDRYGEGRVRYIRPAEPLTMPDHWEFATQEFENDYLLILTDRFVIRPGALAILAERIKSVPGKTPELAIWNCSSGFQADRTFYETSYSGQTHIRPTTEVLEEFAKFDNWRSILLGSNNLPRGLNSAVHHTLIDKIRQLHGRLYEPLTPDYTSAIFELAYAKRQLEIDMPLYAAHGDQSNGQATLRDGVATYAGPIGVDPFEGCPLDIDTVINILVRDYEFVRRKTGKDLPTIDLLGYLLTNLREVQIKKELGSSLNLGAMRRELIKAASKLPVDEQQAFAAGRATIELRDTTSLRIRNALARAELLPKVKSIISMLGLRRAKPRYSNVLEAIRKVPLLVEGRPVST